MTLKSPWKVTGLALVAVLLANPLAAQESRDPTVAPGETGSTASQTPTGVAGSTVVVRDGVPYVVVGTRLYAPGDRFGNMRVERISETEVLLHDGTALVRMPRFAGIERKVVAAKPACAAAQPTRPAKAARKSSAGRVNKAKKSVASPPHVQAMKPPPAAAPCEDSPP